MNHFTDDQQRGKSMAQRTLQSPEWVGQAPVQIIESRSIRATPSAIWAVLVDNEGWVDWFPGFREARFTTPAPHGVGSVRFVHQDQFKVEEQITRWIPNQAWSMTVTSINVPVVKAMAENVELIEQQDLTELRWHIGVQAAPWARVIQPVLVAKSRRSLRKALEQLDARVTQSSGEPNQTSTEHKPHD